MKEFLQCFKKYYIFKERASRQEFWMFCLFGCVILAIGFLLDYFLSTCIYYENTVAGGYITFFFALILLCPFCAVMTRRLHDTGKREIWMILFFIVLAVTLPLIYESLIIYSSDGGSFILSLLLANIFVFSFYMIWLLLTLCQDSCENVNRYGLSPKYVPETEEYTKEETEENTEDTAEKEPEFSKNSKEN